MHGKNVLVEKPFVKIILTAPDKPLVDIEITSIDAYSDYNIKMLGTKGTLSFSLSEKTTYYYLKGQTEALVLAENEVTTDYLTDFYNAVNGETDVILSTEDVITSTRNTLKIQMAAE